LRLLQSSILVVEDNVACKRHYPGLRSRQIAKDYLPSF
jgi:hypothetical protein